MDMTTASRQLTRAVSEATGLSQEEIGWLVTAAAVGTAVLGLVRVVDMLVEVWPVRTAWANA
jgi:hypothetical protein